MVGSREAEVLCQVNNTHIGRNLIFCKELCALAMAHAKEQHIDAFQGQAIGELHIRLAEQPFVDVRQKILGIAGAVHKGNLRFGVVQ